jgi:hypothetical protein
MAAFLAAVALPATSSGGEIHRLPTHAKVVDYGTRDSRTIARRP